MVDESQEASLVRWECAVCGAANETVVDDQAAPTQKFTEDCHVCCRPNLLRLRVASDGFLQMSVEFDE